MYYFIKNKSMDKMSYMPDFGLGTGNARVKQDKGSAFPKLTS